jgi:16S rRNA (guanine1207-N2)-methyltransferase
MASDHYFSARPGTPEARRPLTVVLDGAARNLTTSGGIFSPDGIDKGTAVLLAEVPPPPPAGQFLDIGCGWGPIALTLALKSPGATVTAVDVNERAVALTNDNARALGLANVHACLPEEVDPQLRFDTIWSNPPIRIGKNELH